MNVRCADEFLAKVTEGVVHGLYKVVTRSSFGPIWQHKVSVGKWTFCHCVITLHTKPQVVVEGLECFDRQI